MTKKRFLAFFVTAILTISCFSFVLAACGKKEQAKLTAIELDTTNVKTDYVAGQTLDLSNLVVTAVIGEGEKATKEVVTDYTATPANGTALKTSNTSVSIKYTRDEATASKTFKINVHNNITNVTKVAEPAKTTYMDGEPFNPAGMQLRVTYEDNGTETVDVTLNNATFSPANITEGVEKVKVTYQGYDFEIPVTLANGVFIEAEDGILPVGSVLCVDGLDNDEAHRPSGTGYVGDFKADDKKDLRMTFLFTSDKDGKGDVEFRMASQYLKKDSNWTPVWMGDTQLNKICDVYINNALINVPDSVILAGGGSEDGQPDGTLWLNWQTVKLEDVDLVEGKNAVELKFKEHDYNDCSQSAFNGKFTANIDSLIATSADCKITKYTVGFDTESIKPTGVSLEKGVNAEGEEVAYYVITGEAYFTGYTDEQAANIMKTGLNKTVKSSNASQYTFSGYGFDFQGNLASNSNNNRFLNGAGEVSFTSVASDKDGAGATDRKGTFKIKVDVSSLETANGAGLYSTHFDIAGDTSKNFDFLTDAEKQLAKPETLTEEYTNQFNVSMVDTASVKVGHNTYTLVYEPWCSRDTTWGNSINDRPAHAYGTVGLKITNKTSVEDITATDVRLDKDEVTGEMSLILNGTLKVVEFLQDEAAEALKNKIAFAVTTEKDSYLNTVDVRDVTLTKVADVEGEEDTYTANYTLTVSLNNFSTVGTYNLSLDGKAIAFAADKVTASEVGTKYVSYKLAATAAGEDGTVGATLTVDSNYSVTLNSANIFDSNTVLDLVLENDKVIYKITGSYEAVIKGYVLTDEEDKAVADELLTALLKNYFTNFRFEHNGNQSSTGNWSKVEALTNSHTITLVDDKTFTISVDVTLLKRGWVVMNKMAAATNPNGNGDYKPACTIEGGMKEVSLNGNTYQMLIDEDSWNLLVLRVVETPATPETPDPAPDPTPDPAPAE